MQILNGFHPFPREDGPALLDERGPSRRFLGPQPDDVVAHG
ncbi:hypothetical protein ACWEP8_38245 [Streptomyces hydrogenans]